MSGRLAALGGALRASGFAAALVFLGIIAYCADKLGWLVAIVIGWAPALLLALATMLGHLAVSAALALRRPRAVSETPVAELSPSAA